MLPMKKVPQIKLQIAHFHFNVSRNSNRCEITQNLIFGHKSVQKTPLFYSLLSLNAGHNRYFGKSQTLSSEKIQDPNLRKLLEQIFAESNGPSLASKTKEVPYVPLREVNKDEVAHFLGIDLKTKRFAKIMSVTEEKEAQTPKEEDKELVIGVSKKIRRKIPSSRVFSVKVEGETYEHLNTALHAVENELQFDKPLQDYEPGSRHVRRARLEFLNRQLINYRNWERFLSETYDDFIWAIEKKKPLPNRRLIS